MAGKGVHYSGEAKKAEQLASIHSSVLSILLDHTSDWISIWNNEEQLIFSTPIDRAYFSKEMPQHLADLFSIVHPEDLDEMRKQIEESFYNKKGSSAVYRLIDSSNNLMYIESEFNPIFDEIGRLQYLVIASRDVTERTQCGQKIQEVEQVYRSLFEHNPDGVFTLDLNGAFLSCNDECERLTGYSVNELTNQHFSALVHKRDLPPMTSIIRKLRKGIPVTYEVSTICKDGRSLDVQVTNLPILVNNSITGYFGIAKDKTETKEVERRMFNLAFLDPLTNLPNRACFDERVDRAAAGQDHFVLMILDIDRLKAINDNLGFNVGDALLKELGRRFNGMSNQDELIARLTGDEFGILVQGNGSHSSVGKFMNKLFGLLKEPFIVGKQEVTINTSVGISKFPKDGISKEELVKKANIALAKAKEEAGNSYTPYSRTMGEPGFERFSLEKDLRKAFERKELDLYYQPIVDVSSNHVIGLEALLRWNHPARGPIPPIQFIPIAEDSGLMTRISEWVLKRASSDIRQLNQLFGANLFVTVNISAPQFRGQRFLRTISSLIRKGSIRGEHLKLEITESLLMKDTENTIKVLRALQKMGIEVFIDDFGTGYSSLSYLKLFPIAGLKIDKSFTTNSVLLDKDKAIVKAIIHLARILQLKVTAEGVETRDQLQLLETCQCDYFQGYLFSKPVQLDKIMELL